jgi:hypothetical protein
LKTSTFPYRLLWVCVAALGAHELTAQNVNLLAAPNGGIQPQAAVDAKGIVHLIYYQGDPKGGDIFYVRREPGQKSFSKPLPVNSQPHTATAMGTIRGAQLALGKNGRVHVAWDGLGAGVTSNSKSKTSCPLYYTRLNDAGIAFESERDVITYAYGLDGGSSVAADPLGNVYVTWHAPKSGNTNGEAGRAVFITRSSDEGKTFGRETLAIDDPVGACACCGMRALASESGAVSILYRAAGQNINRDETLLVSPLPKAPFEIVASYPWKGTTCPMSSASLFEAKGRMLGAWETAGQVYYAKLDPGTRSISGAVAAPGGPAGRKYPVAVSNDKNETMLVWTEGTSWAKGGSVAFQLFNNSDKPITEKGRAEDLKPWSLPTAFVEPDGNFTIVY